MEAHRELKGAVSEVLYRFAEGHIEETDASRMIADISYQHWFQRFRTQKRASKRETRFQHR
jgi:hypothetical protein